ncbi:MAG: ribosomal protein S18-alanine N-acetyltransferase [Clostridia bacterium]|jgi:ribosomal-protein-alanine N-acetyltransferase|nr:MAG: ribosomal-protein-alanine N-acetyltransferase [Clostridium sp. CAG:354_28_25]
MNLEIYNMTDYDLSLIKDILIDDFDDFWTYDVLQEELNNPNSEYFVAKLENNILGFAGIWKAVDDVHITDIVVKKSNRQTGIGSKLLEKLIQTAKSQNFNSITLEVNEHNQPAINLYLKYGFKNVGFRKKYYNNKDNAIIMTKEL